MSDDDSAVTDHDALLALLVRMLDQGGGNISVTLLVRGLVVTGSLVSMREFLHGVATLIEPHNNVPGLPEALREATVAGEVDKALEGGSDDVDVDPYVPLFLHVKDAMVYGSAAPTANPWLRLMFDAVDGWSFGFSR